MLSREARYAHRRGRKMVAVSRGAWFAYRRGLKRSAVSRKAGFAYGVAVGPQLTAEASACFLTSGAFEAVKANV